MQYVGRSIVCNGNPAQSYLASTTGTAARVRVRHSASVLRSVCAPRVPVLRPHHVWQRGARARGAASRIPRRSNACSPSARNGRHPGICVADHRSGVGAEGSRCAHLVLRAVGRPSGARLRALLRVASRAFVGCWRSHRRRASQREENQLMC